MSSDGMNYPVASNRKERRHLMAITRKTMNSKHWGEWEHRYGAHNPFPEEDAGRLLSVGLSDGWCNELFAVQRFHVLGCWDRVMIRRHDSGRIVWAEMQRIKNELFGEDRIAVEVLPRQKDVVDSANMYWFFLVDQADEKTIDVKTNNQGSGF